MSEPLETAELQAFAKTVDTHSLSRAAAELKIPRATLSRRLARLEERLGARLLRRTTRSLALTDAGEALYRHARIVLDAVETAEASVRRADNSVRGDLRVSVPPIKDKSFFAMLNDFVMQHPDLRLHVHFGTQYVDLRRDGYDVVLRAGTALEPGMVARTLFRSRMLAVASPEYLSRHGTPVSKADLQRHRCLMGFARGELPQTHWPAGKSTLQVNGVFFTNEMSMLCDAAVRGLGIALLPEHLAAEDLAAGRLVHVLEGIVKAESQLAVVYLEREFVPPQVRAFVDAVLVWAQLKPFPAGRFVATRKPTRPVDRAR